MCEDPCLVMPGSPSVVAFMMVATSNCTPKKLEPQLIDIHLPTHQIILYAPFSVRYTDGCSGDSEVALSGLFCSAPMCFCSYKFRWVFASILPGALPAVYANSTCY